MDIHSIAEVVGVVVTVASALASVLNSYIGTDKKNKKVAAVSAVLNSVAINAPQVKAALGVLKGKK